MVLIGVLWSHLTYTQGEIGFREVWEHYPDEITSIERCGRWSYKNTAGFYRIILVDFLFGGSRLWVQWMVARDKDGRTKALHLSPTEFNERHYTELLFDSYICRQTDEGITIELEADGGREEAELTLEVELRIFHEFGQYEITMEPARE